MSGVPGWAPPSTRTFWDAWKKLKVQKMAKRALIWEMQQLLQYVVWIGGDLQEMEMSTDNCPVHNSVTLRTKWQNHCSSQPSSILYCHLLVRSFVVRLATIGFLCLHELLQPPNSPPHSPQIWFSLRWAQLYVGRFIHKYWTGALFRKTTS